MLPSILKNKTSIFKRTARESSLGADSKMRLNEWGRESHYSGQALFTSYFSFRKISQFEKSAKCWIFKYIGI